MLPGTIPIAPCDAQGSCPRAVTLSQPAVTTCRAASIASAGRPGWRAGSDGVRNHICVRNHKQITQKPGGRCAAAPKSPRLAARWQTLIFKSWSCRGSCLGPCAAGYGDGDGMGARSQPCTHPGGRRLSDSPTPFRHPAQSFPWELVHGKEPGDALSSVFPSKAGNQGSPEVFCCVETAGGALSKATGVRGPGGHPFRLGALQDRSHQQLDALQRPTAPSPPALAFLPLLAPGCR